ncbi:hypothetical protein [Amycolatopsis sp. H20-H5]|uniref:hypothetical protein n=1 Tax=Amycolatopsis sp. H20-H5 TaxID=3046309 RepID=UPI002DBDC6A6|nr:hypothetical protein [Amycolatopsis sp. H20-H5]MEC3973959.1 hypothetical protein [Amycolatopsis sp. H20-H5]
MSTNPASRRTEDRRRGGLLTTLLLVYGLAAVLTVVLEVGSLIVVSGRGRDLPIPVVLAMVLDAVQIFAVLGVWLWRRFAVGVLYPVLALGTIINLVSATAGTLPIILVRILLAVLLAVALSKKWERFA